MVGAAPGWEPQEVSGLTTARSGGAGAARGAAGASTLSVTLEELGPLLRQAGHGPGLLSFCLGYFRGWAPRQGSKEKGEYPQGALVVHPRPRRTRLADGVPEQLWGRDPAAEWAVRPGHAALPRRRQSTDAHRRDHGSTLRE